MSRDFFCEGLEDVSTRQVYKGSSLNLEIANKLKHGQLFDSLVSRQNAWDACDSLPLLDQNVRHIAIPYSYDVHHEIAFFKKNLEREITEFANNWLQEEKYLLSCDRNLFYAASMRTFNYDQVDDAVESDGHNSHFVLFDDNMDKWIVFYSRFPFITVSWITTTSDPIISNKEASFWATYFSDNATEAFRGQSSEFVSFINKTYIPRLNRYKVVER